MENNEFNVLIVIIFFCVVIYICWWEVLIIVVLSFVFVLNVNNVLYCCIISWFVVGLLLSVL